MPLRYIYILFICLLISSCKITLVKNYQHTKPYVYSSNNIEIKGGSLSAEERSSLKQKMYSQQSDSMKPVVKDIFFVARRIKYPPVYDSAYAAISAKNMRNTLRHLGYYNAQSKFTADTANRKVTVKYTIDAGNPTLIDTFSYKLRNTELQSLAVTHANQSMIKENQPVTKSSVLGEISRLVELFRNNGYYKFTPEELRMRGDTSIEALTAVSDDPFETLRLLAEANEKRNKPTIKLAMALNNESDSTRFMKFYVDTIYVYPDYRGEDSAYLDNIKTDTLRDTSSNMVCILKYRNRVVKDNYLLSQFALQKGSLYSQALYNKTLGNFARTGVWQNVNIIVKEQKEKDSTGKINMYVQLVPTDKYGFESNIEASYSTNSNSNNINVANAGNLLGLSGNVSLQSRNVARQGIKITHALRAGVELNLNVRPGAENFINSSEIAYNNTIAVPKLLFPFNKIKEFDALYSKQTFFNTSISHTDRIGLFKLNSFGFALGYEFNIKPNQTLTIKPLNIEFSNLYDRSRAFDSTLDKNPYLRYSFNTALVMGSTVGYNETRSKPGSHRISTLKATFEESGALLYFAFPVDDIGYINKYIRKFVKLDVEKTWTWNYTRHAVVIRLFGGAGLPIGSKDSTLPFFKQYFAGGPNSMRAWPIRGIGPGSKALAAYNVGSLADRTGDIRLEGNIEYRKDLAQLIPNTLTLKWALFADIGNVWNWKNTQPGNAVDSAQFNIKNLYKQLGVNLGTGFRFDFNYVVLRFDFGFRFKRPELEANGGWKAPSIGFDDLFAKLFSKDYRQWRYENFNFTIGLNYPF